ncbi:MAG: hypothetical protein J6A59_14030 [Lachnospiraceae bacterium]|nr:hypothetical protein [Lachnospiraceae bacterium]
MGKKKQLKKLKKEIPNIIGNIEELIGMCRENIETVSTSYNDCTTNLDDME